MSEGESRRTQQIRDQLRSASLQETNKMWVNVNLKRNQIAPGKITSHHVCAFTRACLVRITARLRNRTRNLNSIMLGKQPDAE